MNITFFLSTTDWKNDYLTLSITQCDLAGQGHESLFPLLYLLCTSSVLLMTYELMVVCFVAASCTCFSFRNVKRRNKLDFVLYRAAHSLRLVILQSDIVISVAGRQTFVNIINKMLSLLICHHLGNLSLKGWTCWRYTVALVVVDRSVVRLIHYLSQNCSLARQSERQMPYQSLLSDVTGTLWKVDRLCRSYRSCLFSRSIFPDGTESLCDRQRLETLENSLSLLLFASAIIFYKVFSLQNYRRWTDAVVEDCC